MAEKGIRDRGGVPTFKGYHGFTGSICASVNDEVVHGIPGIAALARRRSAVDRHRDDVRGLRQRQRGDGGGRQRFQRRRAATARRDAGVPMFGHRGDADAANASATSARPSKRTPSETVTASCAIWSATASDGRCTRIHRSPTTASPAREPQLRPGLVLAVEPMITQGDYEVAILKDGWTVVTADGKLAAHFEHTIAVTDEGPRILTLRDAGEPDVAQQYRPRPGSPRMTKCEARLDVVPKRPDVELIATESVWAPLRGVSSGPKL